MKPFTVEEMKNHVIGWYKEYKEKENIKKDKCKRMGSNYCKNECPLGK